MRKGRSIGPWSTGFDWMTWDLENRSGIPAREKGIRRVAFAWSKARGNHRARSSRQDVKIAQLVERLADNEKVIGSNPIPDNNGKTGPMPEEKWLNSRSASAGTWTCEAPKA